MTNKTKTLTPYSKKSLKLGRPSKFSSKMVKKADKYLQNCTESDELPTIEKLALVLGISSRTAYVWRDEHDTFMQTVDRLQCLQIDKLIQKGLTGAYSASMAIFLLKSIHKYRETDSSLYAVQNNFHNITPELLQEAINIQEDNGFRV